MGSELAVGARPLDLIPGDADDLDRLASRLSTFATGMAEAADQLGSIKAGEWKGPAGDAFRTLIGDQPVKYDTAADAFSRASTALSRYAHALREAQADAQRAVHIHEQGQRETQTWKKEWDRHDAEVRAAATSGVASSSPRPAEADPGAGDRARAQLLLEDARFLVDSQGRAAASALAGAREAAPKEPGLLDSILGEVGGAWSAITGSLDDAGRWVADTWDDVSSWLEGAGPSLLEIVGGGGLVVAGGAMIVAAGGMEAVGVGLDATGVGALVGVPLNVGGAAVFVGGVGAAAGGAALLGHGWGNLQLAMSERGTPPPRDLPAFPDAKRARPKTPVQGGRGLRRRWKDPDGNIYEWDRQHGTVERYNSRGKHSGEYDPNTGEQTKPPDPSRKVEP